MSQWTHVIGTIQCGRVSDEEVAKSLGTTWTFEEMWNKTIQNKKFIGPKVPEGSEGSVQYNITRHNENEEFRAIGEGTLIAIEGDLRDYGDDIRDVKELVDWFTQGCQFLDARLAILSISIEFGPQLIIQWDWDLKHSIIQQITWTDFETEYKALLEGKLKWDL